jgi:RNA polymerase sigma-70 factor (ECF subfamily)
VLQTAEETLCMALDPIGDLYRRVGPPAFRLALAIVADRSAAEDIVQEAFVRILRRQGKLGVNDALDGYVTRTVRNIAFNHLRHGRVARTAQERLEHGAQLLVEPTGDAGSVGAVRLSGALSSLPPEQREVIHLRVYEGLPFAEIASRTEVPLGTVHSRYRYALARLRTQLKDGDDEN